LRRKCLLDPIAPRAGHKNNRAYLEIPDSMIRLQVQVDLSYEIRDPAGGDFVFNIHAARTPQQMVEQEGLVLSQPVQAEVETDPTTATRFMRLHANPGLLLVTYWATVGIQHHRADPGSLSEVPVRRLPLDVLPYVYPSRYCQSDRLLRMASKNFGHLPQGYSRVLAIQNWVQSHVSFTSNSSNSSTSAIDTLVEQAGVCRDFTHLMIALCRAVNIPARVATGTDYGADPILGPPDFHAYVEVYLGDRWYIIDPSGTGIPMGFLRIGTGRDAADVAFATIFGDVMAMAPLINVQAIQGEGLEMPHHCQDALSTSAVFGLALSEGDSSARGNGPSDAGKQAATQMAN
jgi:transglutaminase-like putative cysteine protease